jgi:hypothetical protein
MRFRKGNNNSIVRVCVCVCIKIKNYNLNINKNCKLIDAMEKIKIQLRNEEVNK